LQEAHARPFAVRLELGVDEQARSAFESTPYVREGMRLIDELEFGHADSYQSRGRRATRCTSRETVALMRGSDVKGSTCLVRERLAIRFGSLPENRSRSTSSARCLAGPGRDVDRGDVDGDGEVALA
jgi:hypothetical protein